MGARDVRDVCDAAERRARSGRPRARRVVGVHRPCLGLAQRKPAAVQPAVPAAIADLDRRISHALATILVCAICCARDRRPRRVRLVRKNPAAVPPGQLFVDCTAVAAARGTGVLRDKACQALTALSAEIARAATAPASCAMKLRAAGSDHGYAGSSRRYLDAYRRAYAR